MNTEAVYAALRDFVRAGLAATPGVPDTGLNIETADGLFGEEWTGIRMNKLPASALRRGFVSGGALRELSFQLLSKQTAHHGEAVGYAGYLDNLCATLRSMYRRGLRPDLPPGTELVGIEAVRQASLDFAESGLIGYALDVKFIIKTTVF